MKPLSSPALVGADELAKAIIAEDASSVRALLGRGVSPDTFVWEFSSALFLAVHLRRARCAHALIEAGASPHHPATTDQPIVAAIAKDLPGVARKLIDRAANLDVMCGRYELTPLEAAVATNRPALIGLLCRAGADVDRPMRRFPALGQWPETLPTNRTADEFLHEVRHRRMLIAEWQFNDIPRVGDIPRVRLSRFTPLSLVALSLGARRCAQALLTHGADRAACDSAGHGWDDYARVYGKRASSPVRFFR